MIPPYTIIQRSFLKIWTQNSNIIDKSVTHRSEMLKLDVHEVYIRVEVQYHIVPSVSNFPHFHSFTHNFDSN